MAKSQKNKENESIISQMFTEKELADLNFTPEEIETLEYAESVNRALNFMPNSDKDMEALFDRLEKEFPKGKSAEETLAHYEELMKTDPEFIQQLVTMSLVLDEVEQVPPPKSEKISADELSSEKENQNAEKQKNLFKNIDNLLKNMK